MMARVRIRYDQIQAFTAGPVRDWMHDYVGRRARTIAQAMAPKYTGRLTASIRIGRSRLRRYRVSISVATSSGYGLFPEAGTGIYGPSGAVIRPRRAKVLVFNPRGAGGKVFARSVRGQPGQHFMRNALYAVIQGIKGAENV